MRSGACRLPPIFPATMSVMCNVPRWFQIAAASLLIAAAVENWLGEREWRDYLAEAAAAGEKVDASEVIPPPVAEEENFAAIDHFKPLFSEKRAARSPDGSGGGRNIQDSALERLKLLRPILKIESRKDEGWEKGVPKDVVKWQEQIQADGLIQSAPGAKAGDDLLQAVSKFEPDMDALRNAVALPHSRFPIRYEDKFATKYPHLTVLSSYTFIAKVRACANFSLGNQDSAAADAVLGLRLARSIHGEPSMVSHSFQCALFAYGMQPVWEGIARRQWNDAQLAEVESELVRFDFLESYISAIRGERSLNCLPVIESVKNDRGELGLLVNRPDKPRISQIVRGIGWLLPAGCFDFNKAHIARYYDRILKTVSPVKHRVFVEEARKVEERFKNDILDDSMNPRKTLARLLAIPVAGPLRITARSQTMVDLARVAAAVERFRIRHGRLPENLGALTPSILQKAPMDVITGSSFIYRVREHGRYDLYSCGWNGRDDGGTLGEKGDDSEEADWVWPDAIPGK